MLAITSGINNEEIIYLEIRNIFRVRKCKLAVERGTAVVLAMSTAQHQAFLPFPVTHVLVNTLGRPRTFL